MWNNLTVGITRRGRATVVAVGGEIDIASAPRLERVLDQAVAGGNNVVVDLAHVEFMDVSGLRVLLNAHRRTESEGVPLVLVNVPPAVMRLLALTGTQDVLAIQNLLKDTGTG
jgi:anti-sigma B factor antagonist